MAKASKKSVLELEPGKAATSYLAAAFHAFEAGDELRTRRFAAEVLRGKATSADGAAAKELASLLSTPERPVNDLPEDIAAELIARTRVPLKPFVFALLAAAVFALLLTLSQTRYGP